MDRRTFVGAAIGGLFAAPLGARAQRLASAVIGFLGSASPAQWAPFVAAFRKGLEETGYVEGKNVAIEFRWAEGHYDRLPALAADLVQRRVAVIVATGGAPSGLAAKAATSTIPVVFTTGGDPVAQGLIQSLGRPGGNVTGVSFFTAELVVKRLEILHELLPKAIRIAIIVNPSGPTAEPQLRIAKEPPRSFGQQVHVLSATSAQEIDAAFATLVQHRPDALIVGTDPVFNARRDQFVALAAREAVPTMYEGREAVVAGGLISYGPRLSESYRQLGIYTGKILHGAKPADLPVLQPMIFELVINSKTAKALGITIPQSLLQRVDEVIE